MITENNNPEMDVSRIGTVLYTMSKGIGWIPDTVHALDAAICESFLDEPYRPP